VFFKANHPAALSSDAFSKREKANEDYNIRVREQEKVSRTPKENIFLSSMRSLPC
jgi:hypothetical protein